jgi:hypothetical protein
MIKLFCITSLIENNKNLIIFLMKIEKEYSSKREMKNMNEVILNVRKSCDKVLQTYYLSRGHPQMRFTSDFISKIDFNIFALI